MIKLRLVVLLLAALLSATTAPRAYAQLAAPPDEERTVGRAVPDVELIDDSGRTFSLSSLEGKPLVLSPIFIRCPHACQVITWTLRGALLPIGEPAVDYEVITLTFDPADSTEVLHEYRATMDLPAGWILARAEPAALDTLLRAIDFNYSPVAGGAFYHANVVTVLTPDHRVSGYVYGLEHSEDELRRALLSAVAPSSLVEAFKPLIAVVAALAILTTLIVLWGTRKRRATVSGA